jgi:hypothetical protein
MPLAGELILRLRAGTGLFVLDFFRNCLHFFAGTGFA